MNSIREYILQVRGTIEKISDDCVDQAISALYTAWSDGKQVFILGNGGSASTASHMANDLCKATAVVGKQRMRAIALTDCVSLITAWANDVSFDSIFKEQLENLLNSGDVVMAISASGNSPNVLRALEYAAEKKAITIGWTGESGGTLKHMVDICLQAPSDDVGIIESVHVLLDHLVSNELRNRIQQKKDPGEILRAIIRKPTRSLSTRTGKSALSVTSIGRKRGRTQMVEKTGVRR
jgi:D-sedoheptulose 7-phosphate isomerase